MNCKFCGKKINKNSRFCPNCGGKVEEVKEAVIVEDVKNEQKNEQPKTNSQVYETKTAGVLVSAIIVTILSLFTFSIVGLTFSIVAIVFAVKYRNGHNKELSEINKYNSKIFGIISWVLFGLNIIVKIVIGIFFASLISLILSSVNFDDIPVDKIRDIIENYDYNSFYQYVEDDVNININQKNNEDVYLTEIKYEKFKKLYEKETPSVVVLTQEHCPHCILYKPIINEIAKAYDIDIYYIDVAKMSSTTYSRMKEEIDFFVGNNSWGTPTTLIVKDSSTINYLSGYKDYKTVKEFLQENNIIKNS